MSLLMNGDVFAVKLHRKCCRHGQEGLLDPKVPPVAPVSLQALLWQPRVCVVFNSATGGHHSSQDGKMSRLISLKRSETQLLMTVEHDPGWKHAEVRRGVSVHVYRPFFGERYHVAAIR